MADTPLPHDEPPFDAAAEAAAAEASRGERPQPGISDFVRRAVSAGFEAAVKSKEDVVRVATSEIRNWLDGLELDRELRKALSKMTLEVKAEIRFRTNEEGDLMPEATSAEVRSRKGGPDRP